MELTEAQYARIASYLPTKIHLVAADAHTAITFALSPGQAHDAPEGRKLLTALGTASSRTGDRTTSRWRW